MSQDWPGRHLTWEFSVPAHRTITLQSKYCQSFNILAQHSLIKFTRYWYKRCTYVMLYSKLKLKFIQSGSIKGTFVSFDGPLQRSWGFTLSPLLPRPRFFCMVSRPSVGSKARINTAVPSPTSNSTNTTETAHTVHIISQPLTNSSVAEPTKLYPGC